jgi:hypothetical protein
MRQATAVALALLGALAPTVSAGAEDPSSQPVLRLVSPG